MQKKSRAERKPVFRAFPFEIKRNKELGLKAEAKSDPDRELYSGFGGIVVFLFPFLWILSYLFRLNGIGFMSAACRLSPNECEINFY